MMSRKNKFGLLLIYKKVVLSILFMLLMSCVLVTKVSAGGEWKKVDNFVTYNYRAAACDDKGLYVAVGDEGVIKTSRDLTNWTQQESGTKEYLYGCSYGNGKFVAVGNNGTVLYSTEGTKWNSANIENVKDIDFEDIVYGDGKFIAIGCQYPLYTKNDPTYILSSDDGIKWEVVSEMKVLSVWRHIYYVNNKFVATSFGDNIAISLDGLIWTVTNLNKVNLNSISWDGSRYIGVDSDSGVYTSQNLSEWTKVKTNLKEGIFLKQIIKFNNKYILVLSDSGRDIILSSSDLNVWSLASTKTYNEISAVITQQDKLICFGWYGSVLQTKDGVNWDLREKYSPNLLKVVWNGSKFLAIGDNAEMFISSDGEDWKSNDTDIKQVLVDVIWTGKDYTALGITYDTNPNSYDIARTDIYKSLDGVEWYNHGSVNERNIHSIFYFDNQYYLIGRNGQILSSKDAQNWTMLTSGTKNWLRGMAWNGKQYVCVGMFGTIISSSDGVNWTKEVSYTENDFNAVVWNGMQFVAVGSWKTVARSNDGSNWEAQAEDKDFTLEDITWNGKEFLALNRTGYILTSSDAINWVQSESGLNNISNSVSWNGYSYVAVGNRGGLVNMIPMDIVKVVVDGKPIAFDVAPVSIEGRNLVPIRAIFDALGAEVYWDDATKTVLGKKGSKNIVLYLDAKDAMINGEHVTLDVAATAINGRTMVPVRFISESLGAEVKWDDSTKTITIVSK